MIRNIVRLMLVLAAVGCWAQGNPAPAVGDRLRPPDPPSYEKQARQRGDLGRHHGENRHHRGVARPPKALQEDPQPETPPPPATLAQQPPNAPQVNYRNGLLTVAANNSTMSDILTLVQRKTGASIDYPPNLSQERVAAVIGPAPAPQVLAALLNGSRFDYILVGMDGRPDLLQRAIITQRQGGGAVTTAAAPPQPPRAANPAPSEEEEPEAPAETVEQPEEAPPPQQPAQAVPNPQYPQPGQQPAQGQENQGQQPKTPEQLLQELQRMQQQQQQQIQQGQQPQ